MARHKRKTRERARELYLTGEVTSLSEIARRIRVKPHTVGRWKTDEDWDALRLKIDRRAAEQMAERIATERVNLNSQHFKLWGVVVARLFDTLQKGGLKDGEVRTLEKVAGILDRAQKGQRLARGLSLDGKTEEQLRAEFEAEGRSLIACGPNTGSNSNSCRSSSLTDIHDPISIDQVQPDHASWISTCPTDGLAAHVAGRRTVTVKVEPRGIWDQAACRW